MPNAVEFLQNSQQIYPFAGWVLTSQHGKAQFAVRYPRFFSDGDAASEVYFVDHGIGLCIARFWGFGNAIVGEFENVAR